MNRSLSAWSLSASLLLATLCSCSKSQEDVERSKTGSALTAVECVILFELNGTSDICHATGSSKNPYVHIRTSDEGCINGHSNHAGDFADTQTGTCAGAGCFPVGAPCELTGIQRCCSGACDTTTWTCGCNEPPTGVCATDADCCGNATCNHATFLCEAALP